jgi:hypothetical protein
LIDPVEPPARTTTGGSLAASGHGHDQQRRDQTKGKAFQAVT